MFTVCAPLPIEGPRGRARARARAWAFNDDTRAICVSAGVDDSIARSRRELDFTVIIVGISRNPQQGTLWDVTAKQFVRLSFAFRSNPNHFCTSNILFLPGNV